VDSPAEPVGLAALLAPLAPAEAPAAGATVWLVGKWSEMQLWTQTENLSLSSLEPSPWSHFSAHLVVSITLAVLG
jgi:hypothetical protein